jgi:hypothetical protein
MYALRKWAASRPVACFFILTSSFSWSYWLTLLTRVAVWGAYFAFAWWRERPGNPDASRGSNQS